MSPFHSVPSSPAPTSHSLPSGPHRYHPYDASGNIAASSLSTLSASRRRKLRRRNANNRLRLDAADDLKKEFNYIRVEVEERARRKIQKTTKYADPDPIFEEFVAENPGAIPPFVHTNQHCFMLANDQAQINHLKFFDRPVRDFPTAHKTIIDDAIKCVRLLILDGRKYQFPRTSALQDVPFKPNKYPGFEYATRGYKTRKEADLVATAEAEEAFDRLRTGEWVEPHYVRLGGRGKPIAKSEAQSKADGDVKGRLILMLSQRDLKLLGVTEKILTEHCKAADIPIYVGKSFFFRGAQELGKELQGFSNFYCYDAEKFDAAIDPWMVDMAIDILRELFDDGLSSRYDAYWAFVRESLLAAPIIRDDGVVLRKLVGTTSGHSHNTLIQSIITLVCGYATVLRLNPNKSWKEVFAECAVYSLGDDNLIGTTNELTDFSCEDGAQAAQELTAINWWGRKSFKTGRIWDLTDGKSLEKLPGDFEGIQFLGKYFRAFAVDREMKEVEMDTPGALKTILPYRPVVETIVRLLYPERKPSRMAMDKFSSGNLAYMRALGHYIDSAGHPMARAFCDRYLDWLEVRGFATVGQVDDRMDRILFGMGSTDGGEVHELRRMTWEAWLELAIGNREEVRKKLTAPAHLGKLFDVFEEDEQDVSWEDDNEFEDMGFMEY